MTYKYKYVDIEFSPNEEKKKVILTGTVAEKKRVIAIKPSNHYEGRDYRVVAYYENERIVDIPKADIVKQGLEVVDKKYPTEWIDVDVTLEEGEELTVGFRFDSVNEGDHRIIVKYETVE